MTIYEAIAKYKEITNTDAICPGHCNISCDKCIHESKQIIEWLEELVMLRLDSCMIHMPERLHLVENGYNKALDDFIHECDKCCVFYSGKNKNITREDMLNIAEKLKAGVENES